MFDLTDRVAVVTGGASGIGAACLRQLEKHGARCISWDRSGKGDVECDVSDPASVSAALDWTTSNAGTPTLLVAAAGIGSLGDILDIEISDWNTVLATNLAGSMLCMQAVARTAIAAGNGGSIMLISSYAAMNAIPGAAAYIASKAGTIQLARVAAQEFGPHGLRVNVVAPGPTETPMAQGLFDIPEFRDEAIRLSPLRDTGTPERIAEAVVALMQLEWVTGQCLVVDGGFSLSPGGRDWSKAWEAD